MKKSIIFLLTALIIPILSLCSCHRFETLNVRIFTDIKECRSINSDNAEVTIFENPEKDKYLQKLEYQDYFGCEYVSDDFSFELFAYEFSSNDVAMNYYSNATGKQTDPNPTFSDSTGMSLFKRIVLKDNKVFFLMCRKSDKEKVLEFINSHFSEDIVVQGKLVQTEIRVQP